MYRQYEDPRSLEKQLEELLARKEQIIAAGEYDDDAIEYFALEEAELRERINFAWQDEEYDLNYAREEYPEWYYRSSDEDYAEAHHYDPNSSYIF